jgi:hypothetical protein
MQEPAQTPENSSPAPLPPPNWQPQAPPPGMILVISAGLCLLGAGLAAFFCQGLIRLAHWSPELLGGVLPPDAPEPERWKVRFLLGFQHFAVFTGAGLGALWLFYRGITRNWPSWPDYLQARQWPSWRSVGLSLLLMLVSVPLVLLLFQWNKMIPLPAAFHDMEAQTAEALKSLLRMDHPGELLGNLLLIAVLPAIGEELLFRGIVQQQILRMVPNVWLGLLLSAAVFSFIHLQFEGFLPRMFLGLLLGWLYWQTRNFWVPVLAHFFNNGVQVVAQYAVGDKSSVVDLEQDLQTPWPVALLSAFMLWATMRLIARGRG